MIMYYVLRLIGLAILAIAALPFVAAYVVIEAIGLLLGQVMPDLSPKAWGARRWVPEA